MNKHPSYKSYLPDIQKYIDPQLTYSFVHLSNRTLHPPWAISEKTLRRARHAWEMICNNTCHVKGEWFLEWAFMTPAQRRAFAQSKIVKQLRGKAA